MLLLSLIVSASAAAANKKKEPVQPLPKKTLAETQAAIPAAAATTSVTSTGETEQTLSLSTSSTATSTETQTEEPEAPAEIKETSLPVATPVAATATPVLAPTPTPSPVEPRMEHVLREPPMYRHARHWPERHLAFGLGYVNTKWDRLGPSIRNGSVTSSLWLGSAAGHNVEASLGLVMLQGADRGDHAENVGATLLGVQVKKLCENHGPARAFGSLGVMQGAYRAWAVSSESNSSVTFDKYSSGYLVGAVPEVGVRLDLLPGITTDVGLNYTAFVDNPQHHLGGWGVNALLGLHY